MSPTDAPINWKRNLTVAWLGCFLTGAAFSLVMPFLPLYVEQLGVTGHSALNMWSGLVFSITFLFSAIASPFWGGLADRKGRKIMLLPGNMMSWRQFEAVIPLLEKQYHVIDTFAPDPEAKVAIWYGSNEPNMKKAMQKLKRAYPNAQNHPFVGYGHGDIIGHPDVMARDIIAFMKS
mgnify:CR=1 FL=1